MMRVHEHGAVADPVGGRRLTRGAFFDLAIWMVGFGLLVGLVFPAAIVLFGVPSRYTLRPSFFAATLAAGLMVGAVNFALARRVVGARLRLLSGRMSDVSELLREATYSGDSTECTPERCQLPVDSKDALGAAAASFNHLLDVLAASRAIEEALGGFARSLAENLDVDELADIVLSGFMANTGADAGAVCLVREGELAVGATRRLDATNLCDAPGVLAALRNGQPDLCEVPDELRIDSTLLTFRPAAVLLVPILFKSTPVAIVTLAFRGEPRPEALHLVDHLRDAASVAVNNALAHERFQHLAAIDPLTGAYNRRFGLGRLNEEWARAIRADAPLGLLAFDLDHFKAINDTYGHFIGDRVLHDTVAATRSSLREGDVLIRTGGEEFLVVLPAGGRDDVCNVGERIRRAVEEVEVLVDNSVVHVTVSLGAAALPATHADSPQELAEIADSALYAAKDNGRNCLVFAVDINGRRRSTRDLANVPAIAARLPSAHADRSPLPSP